MGHTLLMEAVLADISALAYWRSHSESPEDILAAHRMEPKSRGVPAIDAPTKSMADDIASWGLADREDLHLLVSARNDRRKIKGVSCTVCSKDVPRCSFARTLGQVYVVRPELLFVQLANSLSLAQLLAIGHELCGTYRLGKEPGDAPSYEVEPLTKVAEIRAYAQHAEGLPGRKRALQATQWLADGSASPAETALSIMFRLPYRHGGYGLGKPLLNHEIALSPTAERLFGRGSIRPDFYWPEAKHPAEYDGALYHSSREQAEYDERRRNAYAAMGMSVTILATRHLYNLELLDEMAQVIRKNIGIKRCELPADYPIRHDALFEEACAYWIDLKNSTFGNEEIAWSAARYAAPNMPW